MSPATKTPGKTLRFWALIWVPRTLWWLLWKLQFLLCYPTPRLFFGLGDDGVRSNLGWVLGAPRVEKHIAPVYSNTFDERAVIYTTEEIWMSDIQFLGDFFLLEGFWGQFWNRPGISFCYFVSSQKHKVFKNRKDSFQILAEARENGQRQVSRT